MRVVARPDENAGNDGFYDVVSLYFDNCDDKALQEKLDGVNRREKFRLRYYNLDKNRIWLEKKQKYDDLCIKTQCPITREACSALIAGENWLPDGPHPLLTELDFKMKSQLLRPRTVVFYKREPFVYAPGNVRVTFDSGIQSGQPAAFFGEAPAFVPSATDGAVLLELKYD